MLSDGHVVTNPMANKLIGSELEALNVDKLLNLLNNRLDVPLHATDYWDANVE